MGEKIFIYFVHFCVWSSDGMVTEMSAVRELSAKLDSKESVNHIINDLIAELNRQLLMQGVKINNLILKNFILINEIQKEG